MEYERIHKPQTGIISPSKLRMKLVEVHNQIKKAGSNRSSPRTSPSRTEDSEVVNNSLLKDSDFDDDDEQGSSLEVTSAKSSNQVDQPKDSLPCAKLQQISRGDSGNLSSNHPMRTVEEDNLDYDSNASSSSFEFQKAERAAHSHMSRAFPRPVSSKWNDAEKWIMSRQIVQGGNKRGLVQNQASRVPGGNMGRVAPEGGSNDKLALNKLSDTKRVHFSLPAPVNGLEKFSFVAPENESSSNLTNPSSQSKSIIEFNHSTTEDSSGLAIRTVCMRDTGTEMTPIASQDPSRTSTPIGATTPLRSPSSSLPSTPRRGSPATAPADHNPVGDDNRVLSEEEMKLKTRREIVALGVQLGKVNIAAWASNEEKKRHNAPVKTLESEETEKLEYEKRAAAWVEAEITKHAARLKREEIQIQAWESHEKAKLEAEMRRVEVIALK
uniref:Remorin C-terminal domain-containing protein n=1 Tax=Kalanchoe fedtschenkoi TaxID=63787 RepID=A0A7N0ZY10_KALFE